VLAVDGEVFEAIQLRGATPRLAAGVCADPLIATVAGVGPAMADRRLACNAMALAAVTRGAVDRFDERTTAAAPLGGVAPGGRRGGGEATIIGSPIVLVAVVLAGAVGWKDG
jgi:hypothetical protein